MKQKILNILTNTLPVNTFISVKNGTRFYDNGEQLKIGFAISDYNINNVSGQKIQLVSLLLDLTDMELRPQVFGGSGGQYIHRKPNLNDSKEKYLAIKRIKIPFRKPKSDEKFILLAIERFAQNWLKALKENRDELMYSELVDYDDYFENINKY
jgi:hypothetical protein